MRVAVMVLFLFISMPVLSQMVLAQEVSDTADKPVLIKAIDIEGFVLGDKERFTKLFKPFRGKYLLKQDMDGILSQVQLIYEREGYQELVSITYQVIKRRLVFTVLMKE